MWKEVRKRRSKIKEKSRLLFFPYIFNTVLEILVRPIRQLKISRRYRSEKKMLKYHYETDDVVVCIGNSKNSTREYL